MSLTRRNIIAWVLIIAAAACWTVGRYMVAEDVGGVTGTTANTEATVAATAVPGTYPPTEPTARPFLPTTVPTLPAGYDSFELSSPDAWARPDRGQLFLAYVLCYGAVAMAIIACFVLSQKEALIGPDGALLILALIGMVMRDLLAASSMLERMLYFGFTALVLLAARELWGWVRSRFDLSRCALFRLACGADSAQVTLVVLAGWIGISVGWLMYMNGHYSKSAYWLSFLCSLGIGLLGVLCILRYGRELQHFNCQLANFRNGDAIAVRSGAFEAAEKQLADIRQQHEQAVQTAVTSERFKVELIANVSHDLRTPLTAILGYGELLQREALSPEGKAQLEKLNRKAGYMRELVDSLFELTKVSSGVIAPKKEKIDLIRLLEQTVGLFDDQLSAAGLQVRRHYEADAVSVVTDGARMHQVFANLLGNAIKYALPGTRIHLEVKGRTVRMVNTASYEMDFQPEEILQRFARGDKARSSQGSGLGLAIAQTYTQSVGGQFRVAIDGDQFSAIVELPND